MLRCGCLPLEVETGRYRTPKPHFNRGYASYVKTVSEMKPTFLTIATPSHCSEYSSTKQPHTPSMLISIHSPLTRRLSLSYSYVQLINANFVSHFADALK